MLASLAVACNTGQIKAGSVCRGERISKYNELMRIEEKLGDMSVYGGWNVFCNVTHLSEKNKKGKSARHPFH